MAPESNAQIFIDGEPIAVRKRRLTGAQLAALVNPPADHVWHDVTDTQDQPIGHSEIVAIEHNARFFTDRPRTIYIDKMPYQVRTAVLGEGQLRALPTPAVADDFGIWKDVLDDLDDPIRTGELVHVIDGDRFFSKVHPPKQLHVIVNRKHTVTLHRSHQTGTSIKEAAIAQGVPIEMDFLLSRKDGAKYSPVDDDDRIRVHNGDDFYAVDGDDNS